MYNILLNKSQRFINDKCKSVCNTYIHHSTGNYMFSVLQQMLYTTSTLVNHMQIESSFVTVKKGYKLVVRKKKNSHNIKQFIELCNLKNQNTK